MEFKGTKGSWSFVTTKKGHARISGQDWESFCKVYTTTDGSRDTRDVTKANAKLIAAAPDLLEALQHGLRLAKTLPNKESVAVKMFIKAAKQAIEKALK